MTPDQMRKTGRDIMENKGSASLATPSARRPPYRYPDLDGVGARAAHRVPGLSDVEYLAQSLYEPEKFIVPGCNPGMPQISKPPIGLTDDEILAVISYLQSLGGTTTVNMQTKLPWQNGGPGLVPGAAGAAAPAAPAPSAAPPADAAAKTPAPVASH